MAMKYMLFFNQSKNLAFNDRSLFWHQCDLLSLKEQTKLFEIIKANSPTSFCLVCSSPGILDISGELQVGTSEFRAFSEF